VCQSAVTRNGGGVTGYAAYNVDKLKRGRQIDT
jgi:hypothetical protein